MQSMTSDPPQHSGYYTYYLILRPGTVHFVDKIDEFCKIVTFNPSVNTINRICGTETVFLVRCKYNGVAGPSSSVV